jgi:aminoglycoside phosphotransferase (APT) family kinase protein
MPITPGEKHIMQIDLSSIPIFSGKNITKPKLLPKQGYSNENYSFKVDQKNYLLRKFKLQDPDRELEFSIQSLAYNYGLAAEPLYLDLGKGFMVCDFLEGSHKNKLEKADIVLLVKHLKILHTLKINSPVLDLESQFTLNDETVQKAFQLLHSFPKEVVLCHNDLNPKNCIFTQSELKFIDWEFASMNDLYFDLAAVCVEFDLSQNDIEIFLNAYFGEKKWYQEKLDAYKSVYTELCKQWFKEQTLFPSS